MELYDVIKKLNNQIQSGVYSNKGLAENSEDSTIDLRSERDTMSNNSFDQSYDSFDDYY